MANKRGFDPDTGRGGETHQRVPKRGSHGAESHLTTNQGIRVSDNQNSLKAGARLPRWPRKITLDGLKQRHLALRFLRREDPKWKYVQVRSSQHTEIRKRRRKLQCMGRESVIIGERYGARALQRPER